jgi:murein DD-endopeptidase MepM/ murein hydrolase activator NlpD
MAVNSFKDFLRLANTGNSKGAIDEETWDRLIKTSRMGSYDEPNEHGFIAPLAFPPGRDYLTVEAGYKDTLHHTLHMGTDLSAGMETPIFAVKKGKVVHIQKDPGKETLRGNWIVVKHEGGQRTFYQHNDRNLVVVGQQVVQGQIIATMGSTGDSTGAHLHIELLVNVNEDGPGSFQDYDEAGKYHEDPRYKIPGIYRIPINRAEQEDRRQHPEEYGPGSLNR